VELPLPALAPAGTAAMQSIVTMGRRQARRFREGARRVFL
jgi:hypothetical protein